ncbi:type II toxin-antitoxin system Phd/YefM family antitoxin [Frateuria hangzhouensis]|uniref:type II toxin-antitoxin system Phd/YefM family antitoxin n=1 Tax=Frateuria hangzhouensis TaxID=2995589 RepID=UPI002260EF2F|nr:type II toxin-antitoxin system Phd/YefM family antitoxin [Frateuria sp. STR12]MCX7512200.1 type II toxin-antitoxin system Phd/YefM family antitoxin [Frateuria sp. STR12]
MSAHTLLAELPTMPSSEAKNGFAQLLEQVGRRAKAVVITRNARPAAVMLSVDEYERLVRAVPDPLASLSADFDRLVATMQAPAGQGSVDALFDSAPGDLGAAAAKAAKPRRRRKA